MKDQLKLLLVAGMFVFSGFTYTAYACDSSDSDSESAEEYEEYDDDWWIGERIAIGFKGDSDIEKSLVWTEEEKESLVDEIYEYAREETNKVKNGLCGYMSEFTVISDIPYWGYCIPSTCYDELLKNAGDREVTFTDKFRKNDFMKFILKKNYFMSLKGPNNKRYLLPYRIPSKVALRGLFENFKKSK